MVQKADVVAGSCRNTGIGIAGDMKIVVNVTTLMRLSRWFACATATASSGAVQAFTTTNSQWG